MVGIINSRQIVTVCGFCDSLRCMVYQSKSPKCIFPAEHNQFDALHSRHKSGKNSLTSVRICKHSVNDMINENDECVNSEYE